MKLHAHISLAFNGRCEAAFRFYERCLDGTISFMLTWGKSPMAGDAPPDWESKIFHATLKERIFHALAEDARIEMPLQETFWASRFAVLVDQFGIPWTINCEQAMEATP